MAIKSKAKSGLTWITVTFLFVGSIMTCSNSGGEFDRYSLGQTSRNVGGFAEMFGDVLDAVCGYAIIAIDKARELKQRMDERAEQREYEKGW